VTVASFIAPSVSWRRTSVATIFADGLARQRCCHLEQVTESLRLDPEEVERRQVGDR
jgi:hypothetical protein